jgi:hypothetical protein
MELQTAERSSNLILSLAGRPLTEQVNMRRAAVKDAANYQIWGRMCRLLFDPFGMNRPDPESLDHPVIHPNELNWENDDPRDAPVLALTRDDKSLLIIGHVPQLAEVCEPDTNNPKNWVPTNLPGWQTPRGGVAVDRHGKPVLPGVKGHHVTGQMPAGMMPRRYQQRYSDLTVDYIGGNGDGPNFSDPDCFFVIQPVSQIYMHMAGVAQPGLVTPKTASDGTQMAFLINPKTREGHLVGGAIHLDLELHTLPEGAKP